VIGAVMALAPVLAPGVGGALQTVFGWRAVFFALVAAAIAGAIVIATLMPETLGTRAAEPVSASSIAKSYAIVVRNPAYLAYLGLAATSYAGLFAWISGAAFVLQDFYGLTPFAFGLIFAIGSVGYGLGSLLSARLTRYYGIDGILGFGGLAVAVGGLAMAAAVAFGLKSAASLILPMAVYLAGLGMILPQSIAGGLTPFPERAGAASSLLGFIQQSVAALSGAIVGALLGRSAWPLAIAVAMAGCATLLLWIATHAVRARVAKH
jgi:DHA1 family bicyclomycin/chloramphenicol resistance-like MFS transporter